MQDKIDGFTPSRMLPRSACICEARHSRSFKNTVKLGESTMKRRGSERRLARVFAMVGLYSW